MRHGEAEYYAAEDALRALTAAGQQQSVTVAQQLAASWHTLDLVLVSPYLRAQQTWSAIQAVCPLGPEVITLPELVPEADPATACAAILAYGEIHQAQHILVVSHMPLLGYLLAEFIPGEIPLLFATSSISVIDFTPKPALIERISA